MHIYMLYIPNITRVGPNKRVAIIINILLSVWVIAFGLIY